MSAILCWLRLLFLLRLGDPRAASQRLLPVAVNAFSGLFRRERSLVRVSFRSGGRHVETSISQFLWHAPRSEQLTFGLVSDLANYGGPSFPPRVQALVNALESEGFEVRTSTQGNKAKDGTRSTICVWWGDHYVGYIGQSLWKLKKSRLLGYRFLRGGVFDPLCPDECTGPSYAEVFACEHGCSPSSLHVSGPEKGKNGRKNFYLAVLDQDTAMLLMRETARLLSDLEEGPSERDDPIAIRRDIEDIQNRVSKPTTRKRLVDARTGQGQFRTDLFEDKDLRRMCAVTCLSLAPALRASHIVGFKDSTTCDEERIDKDNGILLSANMDVLFDRHLITFCSDGSVRKSVLLSDKHADELGVANLKIKLNAKRIDYLLRHGRVFTEKEEQRIEAVKRTSLKVKVAARGHKASM